MCRVDVRGTGSSEGIATDEYPADRTHGPDDGDRLARDPGVVERRGGHVRHLVLGVQLDPAGHGATARAEGDHPDLRHRRSLRGRRALLRRRPQTARPGRLPHLHGGDERPAARARRSTATAGARNGSGVSPTPSRGSSTGSSTSAWTTTGSAGSLRFDYDAIQVPDDDHRGLGRRVPQQHLPHVRGAHLPEAVDHRSVVARVHRHLPARSQPRPAARAPEVVGSLAQGHRQRRGPRAPDPGLRAALHPAGAGPRRGAWRPGGTNRRGPPTA